MRLPLIRRIFSVLTVLLTVTQCLTGCGTVGGNGSVDNSEDGEVIEDAFSIVGYSVVYAEDSSERVIGYAEKLCAALEEKYGGEFTAYPDSVEDTGACEIIIGDADRDVTAVNRKLIKSIYVDAFIVEITDGKIYLSGKTEDSVVRAVDKFISDYVRASDYKDCIDTKAGRSVITPYDVEKTLVFDSGVEIDIELISTVFEIPENSYTEALGYPTNVVTAHYPSIIELKHNGENNGKLIGIFNLNDKPRGQASVTTACVMESSDGGATWKQIARPAETLDPSIKGISMAHVFELPAQVGSMPAGTLLYTGNSVDYTRKSHIAIWRSYDCGYTWQEYTIVAEGGGTKEGVWEPLIWYDEETGGLYCFYSDDSDPLHDQKLVYKYSADGVTWSNPVAVCEFEDQKDRPGMIGLTRFSDGTYFMVYEYFGLEDGEVYYKTTDDITKWNPTDHGTKLSDNGYMLSGAPACVSTYLMGGTEVLIVSGKHVSESSEEWEPSPRLFISFDKGETWESFENFLPYDPDNDALDTNRIGHSSSFFVGEDPSVIYYMSCTDVPETGRQRIQFARVRIYA